MLNYKIYDNNHKKAWLVLLHGIGGDLMFWEKQIKDFSKTHNLLLVDLPAHGDSKKDNKNITIRSVNDDIKAILDKHLISVADFVGLSLGAMVLGNFLLQYPEYVNKVVFAASAIEMSWFCRTVVKTGYFLRRFLPYVPIYTAAIYMVIPNKKCRADRQKIMKGFKKAGRKNLMHWLEYANETMCIENIGEKLDKLGKEILFISGEHDRFFRSGALRTSKSISGAKFVILPKTSHICNRDCTVLFNKNVSSFLKKVKHTANAA